MRTNLTLMMSRAPATIRTAYGSPHGSLMLGMCMTRSRRPERLAWAIRPAAALPDGMIP